MGEAWVGQRVRRGRRSGRSTSQSLEEDFLLVLEVSPPLELLDEAPLVEDELLEPALLEPVLLEPVLLESALLEDEPLDDASDGGGGSVLELLRVSFL